MTLWRKWQPLIWRVLIAAFLGFLVALTSTAATTVTETAHNGVPLGTINFSWQQVVPLILIGIAWGDMKRGQVAQSEAIEKLIAAKAAQDERVREFWSDRWPKVERSLDHIETLEAEVASLRERTHEHASIIQGHTIKILHLEQGGHGAR